jgi:hypothetical protein
VAFTNTQKVSVRRYLSFPLGLYQYNTWFESMFDKIGGVLEEQAAVESILAELDAVDAALGQSALSGAKGALKAVDEIEWYAPKDSMIKVVGLVERGHMLCKRLAQCFGDPIVAAMQERGDYFSSSSSVSVNLAMG